MSFVVDPFARMENLSWTNWVNVPVVYGMLSALGADVANTLLLRNVRIDSWKVGLVGSTYALARLSFNKGLRALQTKYEFSAETCSQISGGFHIVASTVAGVTIIYLATPKF